MAQPKLKKDLLDSSQEYFQRLIDLVQSIPGDLLLKSGACQDWSVKDILAHLHAWHMLCLVWYQEGLAGGTAPLPAPGYTWKETPELNQAIFEEYKDEEYTKILESLQESHLEIQETIRKHNQEELFTKKFYKWTGSTSLASYLIANAPSHYEWAMDQIRKWKKSNPDLFPG